LIYLTKNSLSVTFHSYSQLIVNTVSPLFQRVLVVVCHLRFLDGTFRHTAVMWTNDTLGGCCDSSTAWHQMPCVHLWNDLFCVRWDVRPLICQSITGCCVVGYVTKPFFISMKGPNLI